MTREATLIAALRNLASHPSARGLADDCAVVELGGEALVLTHDAMALGVHFLPLQDPADVAWKLVASTLSDLAASGAEPLGVLLGYQLGPDDNRFITGLGEALAWYRVPLLGGDTIAAKRDEQVLGLTALGRATHRPVPSRCGAQAGDALWLSGPVGAALLGFEAFQAGSANCQAWLRPEALLAEGQALAPWVSAMMDVSDGLLLDATRLASASGVTILIERAAVPIAVPEHRRDDALCWGEDYQLLFTGPAGATPPAPAWRIGEVIAAQPQPLLLDGEAPPGQLGYQHD